MPFLKAWSKGRGQGGAAAMPFLAFRSCDRRAIPVQRQTLGRAAGAEWGQEEPVLKDGWEALCFALPSVSG